MIQYYVVENNPVTVYGSPGVTGTPINAYPVGSKIQIIQEESGWLKTISGGYIFKTDDIITFREYKKKHINDLVMTESLDPEVPEPLKKRLRILGSSLTTGDTVKVKDATTKDTYNGNLVPASWCDDGTKLAVTGIDGSTVTVTDTASGTTYHLPAGSLEVWDPSSSQYEDVSSIATAASNTANTVKETLESIMDDNPLFNGVSFVSMDVKNTRTVFGMPYQFLPWVDNRIDTGTTTNELEQFGRKYAQKIAARAPILVLQAGRPEFMRGFSQEDKDGMWGALASVAETANDNISRLVNTPGKYYSLKLVPSQYYRAVNEMARAMASLLGIRDFKWTLPNGETEEVGSIEWMHASEHQGWGFYAGSVGFYINSEPQVNEAFSNTTSQSQLAAKMNELGKMGSELQFYLGGLTNQTGINFSGGMESLTQSGATSNGGFFDSLIDNVQTVLAGGRMIFPEIWTDHTFTRSYNVTIKLDSPDCDTLSIYMNILVPLCHILAFVMPRSVGNNNYISPFLVKAFYKSMFHIDMGIITDCQITKGDVGAWTQNGLPTHVTVQLTIKDLYNVISLATGIKDASITGNPGQLDYIANMCGINIDSPSIIRSIKLWWAINNPLDVTSMMISELYQSFMTQTYQKWYDFTNRLI